MKRSELVVTIVINIIASSSAALLAAHLVRSSSRFDNLETRSLTIMNSKNQPSAMLSSINDAPELALMDQRQRKRVTLFLESNGTPDLYLYDVAGKTRAALNLYDSGVPNLEMLDSSGGADGPSILLEAPGEGRFRLAFHDFRRKSVVGSLEFDMVNGTPKLELIDDSGRNVWSISARPKMNAWKQPTSIGSKSEP